MNSDNLKSILIFIIAFIWVIVLLKYGEDKRIKQLKIYNLQQQTRQNEIDSLQSIFNKWEKHHERLKIYAREWDKTHKR